MYSFYELICNVEPPCPVFVCTVSEEFVNNCLYASTYNKLYIGCKHLSGAEATEAW